MTEEEFEECEQSEREKHDKKVRALEAQAKIIQACNWGVIPPKAEINIREV